jgi:hypothetical protein
VVTRPVGELGPTTFRSDSAVTATELPIDLWAVELLQILLYARGRRRLTGLTAPLLTIVLSCWDELGLPEGADPNDVLGAQLPMVGVFCGSIWAPSAVRVVGLSAQGQELGDDVPAENYLDNGPQAMGWLVLPGGDRDPDLTKLIVG